jgi:hypothetical protein
VSYKSDSAAYLSSCRKHMKGSHPGPDTNKQQKALPGGAKAQHAAASSEQNAPGVLRGHDKSLAPPGRLEGGASLIAKKGPKNAQKKAAAKLKRQPPAAAAVASAKQGSDPSATTSSAELGPSAFTKEATGRSSSSAATPARQQK